MTSRRGTTAVIGLGNPLMGDDGLGLAVLAQLAADWQYPEDVTLIDGGTWGLNLLPLIEDADRLLLADAIDVAKPPGTPVVLERDELPRYFDIKLSPHDIDLRELLALAELRGTLPREICAVGVQPERIVFGETLSPIVRANLSTATRAAVERLRRWGHHLVMRSV